MPLFWKKKEKHSLGFIAFLQAAGLVTYCSLIATLMFNGSRFFPKVTNFTGPLFIHCVMSVAIATASVTDQPQ